MYQLVLNYETNAHVYHFFQRLVPASFNREEDCMKLEVRDLNKLLRPNEFLLNEEHKIILEECTDLRNPHTYKLKTTMNAEIILHYEDGQVPDTILDILFPTSE